MTVSGVRVYDSTFHMCPLSWRAWGQACLWGDRSGGAIGVMEGREPALMPSIALSILFSSCQTSQLGIDRVLLKHPPRGHTAPPAKQTRVAAGGERVSTKPNAVRPSL